MRGPHALQRRARAAKAVTMLESSSDLHPAAAGSSSDDDDDAVVIKKKGSPARKRAAVDEPGAVGSAKGKGKGMKGKSGDDNGDSDFTTDESGSEEEVKELGPPVEDLDQLDLSTSILHTIAWDRIVCLTRRTRSRSGRRRRPRPCTLSQVAHQVVPLRHASAEPRWRALLARALPQKQPKFAYFFLYRSRLQVHEPDVVLLTTA